MYPSGNLTNVEKQCILRFLYKIALTDFKIVEEEKCAINEVGHQIGMDINCSESWLTEGWTQNDDNNLYNLMEKNSDLSGVIVGWSMEVMNSDKVRHQNEQVEILKLINQTIGGPKYPKAKIVPVSKFDDVMIQMIEKTAVTCIEKGDWWQKKKNNKLLKKVGASVGYQINGQKKFVTAVNYELSTPGGSRCAEQNAVGSAIALEPKLEFQNIKDVVVYGDGGLTNPCSPCGVCMENLRKLDVESQINLYLYPDGYKYQPGNLPDAMLQLSLANLNQRQGDK
jgi:cytidine deaminase